MLLHHCTWAEVENYLEKSTGIIVPIGSTEQHGPNGIIGTDAICAEVIAAGVGEAEDALVAPTIAVGMAQHHMAFAGSMTLRPSTLVAVIRDVVASLGHHGFRSFFFVNGHGGNTSTINAAFQEIYSEASLDGGANRPSPRCTFKNWWMNQEVRNISKKLFADKEGAHATPSEVSVTQYVRPEAIKSVEMDGPAPPWGDFSDGEDYRRRYPDGRIGSDPSLATPEAGERLLAAAVKALAGDYRKFVDGG
jgi:creatinine amidohydrolase